VSEKINVQCYKCQTVYELEPEMAGELVECAVCNTVFIIPKLTTGKEFELLHTHPYLPNGNQPSSDELEETNLQTARDMNIPLDDTSTTKLTTDTIKITKNTRGMIPEIEDDKFGIHTARNPIHKPKDNTLETLKKATPKAAKVPPENQEGQKSESEQEQEEGKKASRWWHFGRKKK
jgi:hypothetical protein